MSRTYDMLADSLNELITDFEELHPPEESLNPVYPCKIPLCQQKDHRSMGIWPEYPQRAIQPSVGTFRPASGVHSYSLKNRSEFFVVDSDLFFIFNGFPLSDSCLPGAPKRGCCTIATAPYVKGKRRTGPIYALQKM